MTGYESNSLSLLTEMSGVEAPPLPRRSLPVLQSLAPGLGGGLRRGGGGGGQPQAGVAVAVLVGAVRRALGGREGGVLL